MTERMDYAGESSSTRSGAYEILSLAVKKDWPRRLLHIPTMTSRERQPGDMYGPDKQPRYAILSYTWGRFEVSHGPRLVVHGIDWPIPAINEDHFKVTDLERLVQQIGIKDEYLWIDIACIDQKRTKVKMEDVGRQASIFKGARQAYVWLNRYEPDIIQHHLRAIMACTYSIFEGSMEKLRALEEIDASIRLVLGDFWFSSLWTLQESVLQRHALLLDKRGERILVQGPWSGESPKVQLMDISGACEILRKTIDHILQAENVAPPILGNLQSLRTFIDESGVDFTLCSNPNIQYAAARFRKTTRLEDRIYAIMQVYGYKLGNAAVSRLRLHNFSLEELELQFLRTATSQSTVLSQAFQHTRSPAVGESWCIMNHIRVPHRLHNITVHEQFLDSGCKISVHKRNEAYFEGWAWTMPDLFAILQLRREETLRWIEKLGDAPSDLKERNIHFRQGPAMDRCFHERNQGVMMDCSDRYDAAEYSYEWPPETPLLNHNAGPIFECRMPEIAHAADAQRHIGEELVRVFGDTRPSVLYLGRAKHIEHLELALIVIREGSCRTSHSLTKKEVWKRVGICFWCLEGGPVDELKRLLRPLKGRFG